MLIGLLSLLTPCVVPTTPKGELIGVSVADWARDGGCQGGHIVGAVEKEAARSEQQEIIGRDTAWGLSHAEAGAEDQIAVQVERGQSDGGVVEQKRQVVDVARRGQRRTNRHSSAGTHIPQRQV